MRAVAAAVTDLRRPDSMLPPVFSVPEQGKTATPDSFELCQGTHSRPSLSSQRASCQSAAQRPGGRLPL